MKIPNAVINGALYQAVWLSCVFLQGWWSLLAAAIFTVLHWRFFALKNEWYLVAVVTLIGASVDSVLQAVGVFDANFPIAPLWLWCLWWAFSMTLCHAFGFFIKRYALSVVMGALGGALAYSGAIRAGAAETTYSLTMFAVIMGCVWAVKFPIFLWMASRVKTVTR